MKTFNEKLQAELDKLPFEKGVDDGMYNDGVLDGFELGARWADSQKQPEVTEGEIEKWAKSLKQWENNSGHYGFSYFVDGAQSIMKLIKPE